MNIGFQRALCRLSVALGLVLCLSPFAAQMRLTWGMVMQPIFSAASHQRPLDKEQIDKLSDSARLRKARTSDPLLLGATFVAAPVGLALILVGMQRLRRLRRPPVPVWPANYRPGAAP